MYKLKTWINKDVINKRSIFFNPHKFICQFLENEYTRMNRLQTQYLQTNPNSIALLEKLIKTCHNECSENNENDRIEWINLNYICRNENAIRIIDFLIDRYFPFIDWDVLSSNKGAISILEKYPEKINWYYLSANPNAISILEKNIDKIHWNMLIINENATKLIEENMYSGIFSEIDWFTFCKYTKTFKVFETFPDLIDWEMLSKNPHPNAIEILKNNLQNIDWVELSSNPGAIQLLEKYPENIDWDKIALNPNAIELISKNIEKINIKILCQNKNAIKIIENNLEYILEKDKKKTCLNWFYLSQSPDIFEYDYEEIKKRINIYKEELMEKVFHPKNYDKFVSWGYEEFE